jgi:hypothetical protein
LLARSQADEAAPTSARIWSGDSEASRWRSIDFPLKRGASVSLVAPVIDLARHVPRSFELDPGRGHRACLLGGGCHEAGARLVGVEELDWLESDLLMKSCEMRMAEIAERKKT